MIIRFPICEAEVLAADVVAESRPEPFHGTLTVLVVDDDELVQNAMRAVLDLLGHNVIFARSGEEAVAQLEARFDPDLIILDMNMPGLGGGATLPILRSLRPTVPVLLATGRPDQSALDLVSAHHLVTLLPKPFTAGELNEFLGSIKRKRTPVLWPPGWSVKSTRS